MKISLFSLWKFHFLFDEKYFYVNFQGKPNVRGRGRARQAQSQTGAVGASSVISVVTIDTSTHRTPSAGYEVPQPKPQRNFFLNFWRPEFGNELNKFRFFNDFRFKKRLSASSSSGFHSGESSGRPRPVRGRGRGRGSLDRAEPDIQSEPSKSSTSRSSASGPGKSSTSSSSGEGLVPNIAFTSYLINFASDFSIIS